MALLPGCIRGPLFIFMILGSMFAGLTVMIPFQPLMFFSATRPFYRWYMDIIGYWWFAYATFVMETVGGIKAEISGNKSDLEALRKKCLMILNHRTEIDWIFVWILAAHLGTAESFKIVLKAPLKHLPGAGWATQFLTHLFLDRKWESDSEHITRWLKHATLADYPLQLLLFPEGTDWNPKKLERSNEFAAQHGLEPLEYLLHPKVKGFQHIVNELRGRDYLLHDLTVVYPKEYLDKIGNTAGLGLLKGIFPERIQFHLSTCKLDTLPESEQDLSKWCNDVWKKKDGLLRSSYTNNRNGKLPMNTGRVQSNHSLHAGIGWLIYLAIVAVFLYQSKAFRIYLLATNVLTGVVAKMVGGFDKLYTNGPLPKKK